MFNIIISGLIGIVILVVAGGLADNFVKTTSDKVGALFAICFAGLVGLACYSRFLQDFDREQFTGLPVTNHVDMVGKVFNPQTFIVNEHRTMVYDKDGKVYALDGIKLESGLTTETLTVGTNISYVVYPKGGQLFFGRLGS
jgi:hypothetical protein